MTGGLTAKNLDLLTDPNGFFLSAYFDKGRVSSMLHPIPIYAVIVEDLGQRGAHLVAYQEYQKLRQKNHLKLSITESNVTNELPASSVPPTKSAACCKNSYLWVGLVTVAIISAFIIGKSTK